MRKLSLCLVLACLSQAGFAAWTSKDIAVIINDQDPLSQKIAEYYQIKRHIPSQNLIHIRFASHRNILTQAEFTPLKKRVDALTPSRVQGLVITWLKPFRVDCMAIGTAFAAGFDPEFCAKPCNETRHNPYFDSISQQPFTDFGWRPAMVLAGKQFEDVKQLIDRGVTADYSQPSGTGYLLQTEDSARSSRKDIFLEAVKVHQKHFNLQFLQTNFIGNKPDVMFYFTGLPEVPQITTNHYLPGAIADHLTSMGGIMPASKQMSALRWLEGGATGSYGTVVEPCNFPSKFPNPKVLLDYYLTGSTLIEAYWKSVAQPGQGNFIGEPLAKPFAKR